MPNLQASPASAESPTSEAVREVKTAEADRLVIEMAVDRGHSKSEVLVEDPVRDAPNEDRLGAAHSTVVRKTEILYFI